ncbi:twin-arginine translocase TatA/TatE family subunit [Paenibacillus wenxiniae]|uniref:Sec-independent protein translocase protein TatA n=1 Tax=Paenibacillus wenxiniae TaxID=1636843 RepID=A0ABW4RJU8_9BACL
MLNGMGIGPTGFILLIILALILFGPNKLPELGRAVGRTFREFKEGTRDMMKEEDQKTKAPVEPVQSTPLPQESKLEDKR